MPDEAKFNVLRSAGYTIPNLCCFCKHSSFEARHDWGVCSELQYEHGKHTGGTRSASVSRMGTCGFFKEAPGADAVLGSHAEFRPSQAPAEKLPPSRGKKQRKRCNPAPNGVTESITI